MKTVPSPNRVVLPLILEKSPWQSARKGLEEGEPEVGGGATAADGGPPRTASGAERGRVCHVAHPAITDLDVDLLEPSPRRRAALPRVSAGTVELIRRHGPFRPVVVRRLGARYEILSGLSTWLAVQRAGQSHVPAKVIDVDDEEADRILDAEASGPIARAERYRRSLDRHGGPGTPHAVRAVAREEGISRSSVAHALRLLELPDLVRQALATGALSTGHAKALAAPTLSSSRRLELASAAMEHRWSVRRLEREVADRDRPSRPSSGDELERNLTRALGIDIAVREDGVGGVIELRYADRAELVAVLERLGITE